ncbi:MAG: hypothetical protein HOM77_07460, partial [Planctomycetes bacterium]|nr:hypothetical protein [Planctomycetota bacterium]
MQNTATASFPWVLFVLGLGLLAFIYGAISYWRSMRARQVCLSPEDKQEWAGMPLTAAQRIAWLGLTLGLLEIAGLTAWVISMGGATVYWDDDSFRLSVSGVFVFCLVSQAILMSLAVSKADERGKQSLRGAPQTQVVAL